MIAFTPRDRRALPATDACADLFRRADPITRELRAPSRELAAAWRWAETSVRDLLGHLEADGWIAVERVGRGRRGNVTRLLPTFCAKLSVFAQNRPIFYPGWHQPSDVHRFAGGRVCIHINRFRPSGDERRWRKAAPRGAEDVELLLDSNAFTEVTTHGGHRIPPAEFAEQACRILGWFRGGAVAAQDWMCEAPALARTGLSVRHHQALTTARYIALREQFEGTGVYLMPVLQGSTPDDYVRHVEDYGVLLGAGAWVGVGSVCKLNGKPEQVVDRVMAIHQARPDLRLHGFGQKVTAAAHPVLARLWYSMDSLASSFAERQKGEGRQNDPAIAFEYAGQVECSIERGLAGEPSMHGDLFAA